MARSQDTYIAKGVKAAAKIGKAKKATKVGKITIKVADKVSDFRK